MRILKTAPGNREFFNEHGESLAKYQLIGLIGQTLSGLSLAYAVYALIVAQTAGKAPFVSGFIALIVALFIELSNRVLARPAIRPFVVKDTFADAPELRHRHNILNRSYLIGLISVALLSYLFSAVGSSYYATDSAGEAEQINTDSIKQAYQLQQDGINGTFAADTAMVASPYNMRLRAALDRYTADSTTTMAVRSKYLACANQGNKYCKGQLTSYLANISRYRAALADSTGTIAREKAAALAVVLADRKSGAEQLRKSQGAELSAATADNKQSKDSHNSESRFQGIIFIILTVAGQTLFYYMVFLTLQVEAGSEIIYTLEPNEFWNLPGAAAELASTLAWRTERGARRAIAAIFPQPTQGNTAIPYASLFAQYESEESDDTTQQDSAAERKARKQRCDDTRARTRTQDVDVTDTLRNEETRQRKPGEVGALEPCQQCGTDYVRRTTRQRFCSDDCRLDHHASKHNGKRFDHILNGQK
jgi:hypothetical protein